MNWTVIAVSIVCSWIASVLAFPALPLQHWLNSRIRWLWKKVTFHQVGITGRWLAVYEIPRPPGSSEQRIEIVKCSQLSGCELRGSIRDECTGVRYKFLGRIVFDELVAHYWSVNESRDIGNFKFHVRQGTRVLSGPLTLHDTKTDDTKSDLIYHWYRYPLLARTVYSGISEIEGAGLFTNKRFEAGHTIGKLALGKVSSQNKYTIEINGQHRIVKKPWRFLNHSCEPNAYLKLESDQFFLRAIKEILPQCELTIDYRLLGEKIGESFDCKCPKCKTGISKKI